ncbi:amino acid adenylation domain-containing protein [Chryseobacterium piperi]
MIPRFVVVMPHLPLNTNGKIDRKQLPAPSYESVGFGLYKAPVSKTEILLVEIWQEVLALSKVGITDNFFELGGHSLMVDQVINRINRQLGKTISFRIFFTNPTIEGLIKKMFENEYTPIPQSPEATSYPLTTSQSRLWILSQLDGGSLAYNMSSVIKLKGNIEIDIFEESFKLLIGRHEILRTYFESNEDGEIHQYILPKENLSFKVEVEDFSLSENQEEAAIQHVQNISNRPFDLEQAPLFRVLLCKVQKDEFLLLFSMHHIIGDGWSSRIAISEFVNIYNSLTDGTPVSLPVLDIQYKDYTLWMQEETKGEKFRKAEAYWLEQFEGELPVLELPSFNSRPLIQTYNGNSITHQFQEGFLEKLETFSKAHDATLFMLLMTGINALLYKYSNQKDMVIGIPIAGREHPDLENQLGLYLNTLAIRTRLREKNSFSDLLAIQKEALLGAYDHQIYPFDKLVEKLDLKRDTSRSALFDVMVVLQNQRQINSFGNEELSNIKASDYQLTSKTSQFDISFIFVETDKLNLTIEYNTDIYDEFLIQRMFTHFENLITDVIEDSTGQVIIEDIDCLTNAERNQLLIEFNDKKMDYPSDKTIAQLFEEQVDKTPENAAVFFENTELTYRELNEQANQLGDYLRQKYQLKPDDLVAIKLERSEKMIVSIFGILKSGAAYVPIDPNYPQERVEYIEKDTKTKVTIDEAFLENYRKDLEKSEKDYTKENLPIISTPDSLAYVIYTSGTTGEPKGVMIENKNLTNLIWGQVIEFDFKDNESVLLFANYTFDASVEQIFLALLRGAVLHVVSKNIITDPKSLQEYIKEHQVTHFHTVPIILDKMTLDNDTHLNRIISGGDTCSQKLVNRFDNHSFSFYNGYGPTEVTVTSIQLLYAGGKISIGKPLSNTQVYILDDNKEVVPVGVGGKLYISGDGLSRRGYLNKPELTSERFVGNPFDAEMKMYDTGDLARWLPNGNIEFLGRHDFQIKIRGFRIELGEIETNVRQFSSSIRQVFAEAKEFNGEKVLVVYYAYAGNASIGKTELREFLQSKLPEYMVPSFYVELEMLPLNANGKVDRKLLPDISENDVIKNKYVAPENEIENQLVLIWQEVLGINKIGITDHFFELGGNSLNALTVWSKIKKLKNLNIKLSDIYSSPTIQKLSIIKPNKSLLVDLNTSFEKKNTSMYCIPPITGIPGVFKNLSARVESNINCYGFEYSGINNGDAFFKSIEEASQMFCKEIIERHQGHSHIIIFGYSMGGSIAFEMMKTLENKYDNISFVLAESYISKNHYQEDIIEENTNNNLEIIEAYAKENNIDFDQNLKNYIINNNTIFNQYFQKGKIKSDIYLFQSNESSDNMLEWEKFTNGSIEIEKIKGNHWEAMSEFNNEIYEKRINELFK